MQDLCIISEQKRVIFEKFSLSFNLRKNRVSRCNKTYRSNMNKLRSHPKRSYIENAKTDQRFGKNPGVPYDDDKFVPDSSAKSFVIMSAL